jgi:hypothetical protein
MLGKACTELKYYNFKSGKAWVVQFEDVAVKNSEDVADKQELVEVEILMPVHFCIKGMHTYVFSIFLF